MSIHIYKCQNEECKKVFESIEKPGTKFAYCPECKMIGIRQGIELPSPAQIEDSTGAVYRPRFKERSFQ
jgi:hypothetical protein